MEALIEAIRAATVSDANDQVRAAGAQACRTILTALEARAGEPMTTPSIAPVAAMVSALRGMPPDQLLDLAIARLKAALPAGAEVAPVAPLKFQLLPLPPVGGRS